MYFTKTSHGARAYRCNLRFLGALPLLLLFTLSAASPGTLAAQIEIKAVEPDKQRVGELITIHGKGFGSFQPGVSRVIFAKEQPDQDDVFVAGTPYVWRDNFIQVPVPVGNLMNGVPTPIPKTDLRVFVVIDRQVSNPAKFKVISVQLADLAVLRFQQLTKIENDQDVSFTLGHPRFNLARTKDAEIGDVNNDGWPDIVDNNSNNILNDTHGVVRTNLRGSIAVDSLSKFRAIALEPADANDTDGPFATRIPPGGTFIGDATTYDSDLVDLTNDGFPELVQALANSGGSRVRVLRNSPFERITFVEDTLNWIPDQEFNGRPDDVAHVDFDNSGFVDIGIALRNSATAYLYRNKDGDSFIPPITLTLTSGFGSIHDSFFIDAEGDGDHDAVLVNEFSGSQVFLNDGAANPTFTAGAVFTGNSHFAGLGGDFNGDGLDDFAQVGFNRGDLYLNDPAQPGTFQHSQLPLSAFGPFYDLEAGDVDLDGDLDLIAANITTIAEQTVVIWLNNGSGGFIEATSAHVDLPDLEAYQRLSADLIDFDRDGDLDFYITGADGQNIGFGFGAVANQFYRNLRIHPSISAEP